MESGDFCQWSEWGLAQLLRAWIWYHAGCLFEEGCSLTGPSNTSIVRHAGVQTLSARLRWRGPQLHRVWKERMAEGRGRWSVSIWFGTYYNKWVASYSAHYRAVQQLWHNIKILSPFTHLYFVPNLYDFCRTLRRKCKAIYSYILITTLFHAIIVMTHGWGRDDRIFTTNTNRQSLNNSHTSICIILIFKMLKY